MAYEETSGPPTIDRDLVLLGAVVAFPPAGAAAIGACLHQLFEPMNEITKRWCRTTLQRSGRSHLESREFDAFGHCWIACEGSRVCGEGWASTAGFCHEVARELGFRGHHDSFAQDLRNQAVGRQLSRRNGRASFLCDEAYRLNRLDLTAPITRWRFSLAQGFHEFDQRVHLRF